MANSRYVRKKRHPERLLVTQTISDLVRMVEIIEGRLRTTDSTGPLITRRLNQCVLEELLRELDSRQVSFAEPYEPAEF